MKQGYARMVDFISGAGEDVFFRTFFPAVDQTDPVIPGYGVLYRLHRGMVELWHRELHTRCIASYLLEKRADDI